MRAREGAGICSELDRMLIALAGREDNVQSSAAPDLPLFKPETSASRMGYITPSSTSTMEGNLLTLDDVKPPFIKGNQLTSQDGVKPSLKNIRDGKIGKPRTDNKKKYSSRKTIKKTLADTATKRPFTRSRMAKHVEKWKWWI